MIIIIGSTGLVGSSLSRACMEKGIETWGTSTTGFGGSHVYNLYDGDPKILIKDVKIVSDSISAAVITGAINNIHECYVNQEKAYAVNVVGTIKLIQALYAEGIKPVFLSSDAVFDGENGKYTEQDRTNPRTVYGRNKKDVEDYILNTIPEGLILRLSKQYDISFAENSFFGDLYREMQENKKVRCIEGLFFNPTYVGDTANCIIDSIECGLKGLYNLASPEVIERYELVNRIAKVCGISECEITNEDKECFSFEEPRSFNCSMNTSKFCDLMNYSFKSLDDSISLFSKIVKN